MRSIIQNFLNNNAGAIAIKFALLLPALLAAVGMGVDYTRVMNAEREMKRSLSVIEHMGGMQGQDYENVKKQITQMILANYKSETIEIKFTPSGSTIKVEAREKISTPFLSTIGRPEHEIVVLGNHRIEGPTREQYAKASTREKIKLLKDELKILKRSRQNFSHKNYQRITNYYERQIKFLEKQRCSYC